RNAVAETQRSIEAMPPSRSQSTAAGRIAVVEAFEYQRERPRARIVELTLKSVACDCVYESAVHRPTVASTRLSAEIAFHCRAVSGGRDYLPDGVVDPVIVCRVSD